MSPIISGVISNVKKASAQRSIEGYIKAIELAEVKYQYKNGGTITRDISKLSISSNDNNRISVSNIKINKLGMIESGTFIMDGVKCNYVNSEAKCNFYKIITANVENGVIQNTWDELKVISSQIADSGKKESELIADSTLTYGLHIGDHITTNDIIYYIIGFNHGSFNTLEEDYGEMGITFAAQIGSRVINTTSTNAGGYIGSEMYSYIKTIELPTTSREVVKLVDTGSRYVGFSTIPSVETRWLLSFEEAGLGNSGSNALHEGNVYPFLKLISNRNLLGGTSWWTRSVEATSTFWCQFWCVYSVSGSTLGRYSANRNFNFVLAFCI